METVQTNLKEKGIWQRFFAVLNQTPPIGGLEVGEDALRFALLKNGQTASVSLRLAAGIISAGEVHDRVQFVAALKALRGQLAGVARTHEKLYVAASFPFSRSYIQMFTLPPLEGNAVKEAAKLNMQMISPAPLETVYYDFEKLAGGKEDQDEYLAAFAPIREVELFHSCLLEAGFVPVSIEFSSLALARFLSKVSTVANKSEAYVLLSASVSGVTFLIVRGGHLYFDYTIPWSSIQSSGKSLSLPAFQAVLDRSLQQVLNFYSSKFGGVPAALLVSSDASLHEVIKTAANRFKLSMEPLTTTAWPNVHSSWFISLGLALRGVTPRSEDSYITLAQIGTEDEYLYSQIRALFSFWRTILISVLSFILVIFFISNGFLANSLTRVEAELKRPSSGQQAVLDEVTRIQTEAGNFNNLLSSIELSQKERHTLTPFLEKLVLLAGSDVSITRIFYQSPKVPVRVSGTAASNEAIITFRDRINKEAGFQNADVPPANASVLGNRVKFDLTFSLTDSPIR